MQTRRSTERGGANLKFLMVMAFLGVSAYAGYLYVPVAFSAHTFGDLMQHYVDVASTEGKTPEWAAAITGRWAATLTTAGGSWLMRRTTHVVEGSRRSGE